MTALFFVVSVRKNLIRPDWWRSGSVWPEQWRYDSLPRWHRLCRQSWWSRLLCCVEEVPEGTYVRELRPVLCPSYQSEWHCFLRQLSGDRTPDAHRSVSLLWNRKDRNRGEVLPLRRLSRHIPASWQWTRRVLQNVFIHISGTIHFRNLNIRSVRIQQQLRSWMEKLCF